jgi:hypothetical protein
MNQLKMPLVDFYRNLLPAARARGFKIVLTALAREADSPSFYEDVKRYWSSLDDATGPDILFIFAGAKAAQILNESGITNFQEFVTYTSDDMAIGGEKKRTLELGKNLDAPYQSSRASFDEPNKMHMNHAGSNLSIDLNRILDNLSRILREFGPEERYYLDKMLDFQKEKAIKIAHALNEIESLENRLDYLSKAKRSFFNPTAIRAVSAQKNHNAESIISTAKKLCHTEQDFTEREKSFVERLQTQSRQLFDRISIIESDLRMLHNPRPPKLGLNHPSPGFFDEGKYHDENASFAGSHSSEIGELRQQLGLSEEQIPCLAFTLLNSDHEKYPTFAVPFFMFERFTVYQYLKFVSEKLEKDFREIDEITERKKARRLPEIDESDAWLRLSHSLQALSRARPEAMGNEQWDFFVAYPTVDRAIAQKVFAELQKIGRAFIDVRCLKPGDMWVEEIRTAQNQSKSTVAIITNEYQNSWFAQSEVLYAIELSRHGRHSIIPILYGDKAKVPYGLEQVNCTKIEKWEDIRTIPNLMSSIVGVKEQSDED